ncbi:unnamed protein product [Effrenium voratum]|nr:unnamed protein product [Effrenium voratum]
MLGKRTDGPTRLPAPIIGNSMLPAVLQRPRANCYWVAVGWWGAVLFITYASWCWTGCQAYMPFISDMGLQAHMPILFVVGTMVEGCLLGLWLLWATIARHHLLKALRLQMVWLECLCALSGLPVVAGTMFIGFFPWDSYSYLHFACASGVFWGGCGHCFFSTLICHGISMDYSLMPGHTSWIRRWHRWLAPLLCLCFFGVFLCFCAAMDASPERFHWSWWPELQAVARERFLEYCGQGSWHGLPWVNTCAALEWLTLALLCVSISAGQADFEMYLALMDGVIELPAPSPLDQPQLLLGLKMSRVWWVMLTLFPPLAALILYALWVSSGCSWAPPFMEHLAGRTSHVYKLTLWVWNALLAVWLFHVFGCQWLMARQGRPANSLLLLAGINVAGGGLMVCGLGLAAEPWDFGLAVHLMGADSVLAGFGLWSTASILLSQAANTNPSGWQGQTLRLLIWTGAWSVLSLSGSGLMFHLWAAGGSLRLGVVDLRAEVRKNFRAQCEGFSLPSSGYALCQWLFMGLLHAFVVCTIHDSEACWSAVAAHARSGKVDLVRPLSARKLAMLGLVLGGAIHASGTMSLW